MRCLLRLRSLESSNSALWLAATAAMAARSQELGVVRSAAHLAGAPGGSLLDPIPPKPVRYASEFPKS
jgi:hypothetical protein